MSGFAYRHPFPHMHLSVITDEISQDFEHALDVMVEHGVRLAELRGLWGTNVTKLTPEQQSAARRALDARGMAVSAIASPAGKAQLLPPQDEAALPDIDSAVAAEVDVLWRAVEMAHLFGAPIVRIFAFLKQPPGPLNSPEAIAGALGRLVESAAGGDVALALENEHSCYNGTGAETRALLETVGRPDLGVVWDPGNSYFSGETPFPDGYREVRDRVLHVHVKDAVRDPGGGSRWVVVGTGDISYREQLAALRSDGYDGAVSLETHLRSSTGDAEKGTRDSIAGLQSLLLEVAQSAG